MDSADTLLAHDDDGLEEGAGDAGGDGEEIALSGEDLDLRRRGELGQVGLHAVAHAADGLLVGGDGWHVGQQRARMNGQVLEGGGVAGEGLKVIERVCFGEGEDAGARATKAAEMGTTAEGLPELVGDRADVSAGADVHGEGRLVALE